MSTLTELFEEEGAPMARPVTSIVEDSFASANVTLDDGTEDQGEVTFVFKVAHKGSSVKRAKATVAATTGPASSSPKAVSFAEQLSKEYPPEGEMSVTGEAVDRSKSMDFRGINMAALNAPSEAEAGNERGGEDDDGNPQSIKESYKAMIRRRGARKGRRFRDSEAPQSVEEDDVGGTSKQDEDYNEETKRLHRQFDELQLDVYNLDLEIAQKIKLLEAKKKELREVADQLEHRPKSLAEMEADHGVDDAREFAGLKDEVEPARGPRTSRIDSAPGVRESIEKPSLLKPDHDGAEGGRVGVLRVLIMKLNKFSKNTPRVLELHGPSKTLSLFKVKENVPQYKIDASMIVSAIFVDKSPLQMRLVFFASSQRLLRSEKDWKIKFESTFERERVYRLLKETLMYKEARGTNFVYKPQPLTITKAVQARVDALPVRRLAEQLHVVWTESKAEKGWTHGPRYEEKSKTHPEMCAFEDLGKEQQAYDLGIANLTLAGIFELGYDIQKAREGEAGNTEQLDKLIEFLAENAHESWAANKMKQGWTHGAKTDAASKSHSQLVPYADMPEEEKEADRDAAITIISTLILWRYGIQKATLDV